MDMFENVPDIGQDSSPDTTTEQLLDGQDSARDVIEAWLPLREAAPLMGLSIEAARKRAQRGTIRARKADDGWLVAWPAEMDMPSNSGQDVQHVVLDNNSTEGQGVPYEMGRTHPGHGQDDDHDVPKPVQDLIDAQRSEIAFLRSELETRSEEIRRRDHILAGLLQELSTIKALVPGEIIDAEQPTSGTSESANASLDAQDGSGRVAPSEMTADTLHQEHNEPVPTQVQLATGWRRWFRWLLES